MKEAEAVSVRFVPTVEEKLYPQAILEAVQNAAPGILEGVEAALSKPGANINAHDGNRRSALHHAIYKDRDDIVKLLIRVPGIILCHKDKDGFTPLHTACRYGAVESALLLLRDEQSVGQVNSKDNRGRTPAMLLYLYVKCGEKSVEDVRVINTTQPSAEEMNNRQLKKAQILEVILQNKDYDIFNTRDDLDRSVFSFAVAMGDEEWAQKMLQMTELLQETYLWKELGEICIWETKNRFKRPSDTRLSVQESLSKITKKRATVSAFLKYITDTYKKPEKVRETKVKRLLRDYMNTSDLKEEVATEVFEEKWLYLVVSCAATGDSNFLRRLHECELFYKINELTSSDVHQIYKMARVESLFIDLPESDNLDDILVLLGFPVVQKESNVFGALHFTFPFVCAVLGKLNLVGTYFELTEANNTIPLGAFMVWILRAILSYKSFSHSRESKIFDLIKVIDNKISQLSEITSQRDLKDDDRSVTRIFLSEQVITALGKRTVIQTAVDGACNDFLDLHFCQKHVEYSWLPFENFKTFMRFRDKLWAFILPFLFVFLYFPLLVFSVVVMVVSLPFSLLEMCVRPHRAHPVFVENIGTPRKTLLTLVFSRILAKATRRCRSQIYKPFVRFLLDGVVHFVLIIMLSYFVQRDLHYNFHIIEIIIYILLGGFTLEEIRQIITRMARSSAHTYISDGWNWIDWLFIISMYSGIGFRVKPHLHNIPCIRTNYYCLDQEAADTYLYIARICFVIGTILCYMKFLRIASYHRNLGPKLRMISEMIVTDLIPFMFILAVFIFAFGAAFSALLFPNARTGNDTKFQSWSDSKLDEFSIARGFALAFYNMLGDFTVLSLTQTGCDMKKGYFGIPNDVGAVAVPFGFLVVYVILVKILLLNLLIALFGQTISLVSDKSRMVWYKFRVDLIDDYLIHSVLPPPMNVFDMIFDLFHFIQCRLRFCYNSSLRHHIEFKNENRETSCIAAFCYIQCKTSERNMNKVHHDVTSPVQVKSTMGTKLAGVSKVMFNINIQTYEAEHEPEQKSQAEAEPEPSREQDSEHKSEPELEPEVKSDDNKETSTSSKISKTDILEQLAELRRVSEMQYEILLHSNHEIKKLKKYVDEKIDEFNIQEI